MRIIGSSLPFRTLIVVAALLLSLSVEAQVTRRMADQNLGGDGQYVTDQNGNPIDDSRNGRRDSTRQKGNKEVPMGLRVWTVDELFGDMHPTTPDTLAHLYHNTHYTQGLYGQYNTLGNLGSPRQNRIFIDRPDDGSFLFTQPYDFVVTPVESFHFTNTYSPITNVTLNECGNRTNGEDDFKAMFAVNAGKRLGVGFRFDYKYGRGYYPSQSTSHFKYTMWGSYLGERYQAHLLFSILHQKVAENGGITTDDYVTHPESFDDSYSSDELPTVFEKNWNRNDNQHIFFTHRYSLGFNRKVPMTEEEIKARKFAIASKKENEAAKNKEELARQRKRNGENITADDIPDEPQFGGRPEGSRIAGEESDIKDTLQSNRISVGDKAQADSLLAAAQKAKEDTSWLKNEYVPVTSFIHTVKFDNYRRIYEAYQTPANYYLNSFNSYSKLSGDSIFDRTSHYELKNTFAIALLEGFNKYAKAGLKAFVSYDMRHYELPDSAERHTLSYNENTLYVGGALTKTQGTLLHYGVVGEVGVLGDEKGQWKIDGNADLNFRILGDTVRLEARAFMHSLNPSFYFRHYHSRHLWWDDDDMDKTLHSRIEGIFTLKRTRTTLRVAVDEIKNMPYFSQSYTITNDGEGNYGRSGVTVAPFQHSKGINILTAQLRQDFRWGILRWENILTFQKSSNKDVLPLPTLNAYSNLYIHFRIARVLDTDLGADARYFTSYYAPDYSPALGQFAVQGNSENRVKIGNYPWVNVYLNFNLKHTRFFVMYSHLNSGSGNKMSFLVPHYPTNESLLRLGVSWTFYN